MEAELINDENVKMLSRFVRGCGGAGGAFEMPLSGKMQTTVDERWDKSF